ncbi:MAG: hypothetical protein RMJ98_04755 [Myxococcales bacterium]|nr:hypothetical protein [Polyangiaceae bacterium]MDW8248602.1 hypothetical protein [Myxococcales bacterium]
MAPAGMRIVTLLLRLPKAAGMVRYMVDPGDLVPLDERFTRQFRRWAARVRRRALLSSAVTGVVLGLLVGAGLAALLWKTRYGALRPWSAAVGLVGGLVGGVFGYRRRWSDQQIALYLDGRLQSREVVTTALEFRGSNQRSVALLLEQASSALEHGNPRSVRLPVFRPVHSAGPLAVGAIAYLSVIPVPPATIVTPPPGIEQVRKAEIKGLEKVEALARLKTPDPEQRRRLDKIAKDATELREKLRQGTERREALAEIARLQDAVQNERLSLGDGERKQGLEAALDRLSRESLLKEATKALGDRDLIRFDEEMQKVANAREKEDRERARKALEEAAEAARKQKAEDVARALERQKELLEQRSQKAEELRALGDALKNAVPPEQRKALEQEGIDSKDARKAAKAMEDALRKLSPEEKKRLVENLKKRLQQGDLSPQAQDQLRELAKNLDTPEGQKQLEDELRRLASEELDEGAELQEGLDEAQEGLGQAQGELGAIPLPGQGSGDKGPKGHGPGAQGNDTSQGGEGGPGGNSPRGQKNNHQGQSKDVDAPELRARAKARMNGSAPGAGITLGRTAGREGDTANRQGTGALGQVGPSEVSGVDSQEVPEEYREQIGRYFQP